MFRPMTFEEAERVVNRSLKSFEQGEDGCHGRDWNRGFTAAFQWTQRRLEDFKKLYVLKSSGHVTTAPEPVKPIPFKVGQTLRRTSDGLKCMIVQNHSGFVYMLQMNNGQQFAERCVNYSKDITPEILQKISGGYIFVTEKQGLELGLAWATEEASRDKRGVYGQSDTNRQTFGQQNILPKSFGILR